MQLAEFQSVAHIDGLDLIQIVAALETLAAATPVPGAHDEGRAIGLARRLLAASASTARAQRVAEIPKDRVLDAASFLLEAASALHRAGRHAEAFAAEGIEGRLVEALIGAGSFERAS